MLILYIVMSCASLALFFFDKWAAQSGAWRIPELWLHFVELIGGWPGALLGAQVFKHKRQKSSYMMILYGISILHVVFWVWYLTKS